MAPRPEFTASQSSLYSCKAAVIFFREGVIMIASESFDLAMCDKDKWIGAEGWYFPLTSNVLNEASCGPGGGNNEDIALVLHQQLIWYALFHTRAKRRDRLHCDHPSAGFFPQSHLPRYPRLCLCLPLPRALSTSIVNLRKSSCVHPVRN